MKLPAGGRWAVSRGVERLRADGADAQFGPGEETQAHPIHFYEGESDPATLQQRQSAQWVALLSSSQLADLGKRDMPEALAAGVQQARHRRFAAPLVSLVMLLLGIPFLLHREPGTILSDLAKCVATCGTCFVVTFVTHTALGSGSFSALPAWLPIIVFLPVAVVLVDRIRT